MTQLNETANESAAQPHFCQSCSMPMTGTAQYGTEQDGSSSPDYCSYCYEEGSFREPDQTMEGMIRQCVPYMVEEGMEESKARSLLSQHLPQLKRWKAASAPL